MTQRSATHLRRYRRRLNDVPPVRWSAHSFEPFRFPPHMSGEARLERLSLERTKGKERNSNYSALSKASYHRFPQRHSRTHCCLSAHCHVLRRYSIVSAPPKGVQRILTVKKYPIVHLSAIASHPSAHCGCEIGGNLSNATALAHFP